MGGPSFVAQLSYTQNPSDGVVFGMPENQRYRRIDQLTLLNNNLWPGYRRGRLRKSWQSGASIIQFFGSTSAWENPYLGQFFQWSKRPDADLAWGVMGAVPIGKAMTSALLVATAFNNTREVRISMGSTVLPFPNALGGPNTILGSMQAQVDDSLPNKVWRNGPVTCRWMMWPVGEKHLLATGWYLRFVIRLRSDPAGVLSKTYDASITLDVRFFRDQNGRIRASGDHWGTWVEGGAYSQGINEQLEPRADTALDDLVNALNLILSFTAGNDAIDHYLLPGVQASASLNIAYDPPPLVIGDVSDDATLVLEFPD